MAFILFSICSLLRRKQPHLSSVNLRTECPGEPASEYRSYWLTFSSTPSLRALQQPRSGMDMHSSPERYLLSSTLLGMESHGEIRSREVRGAYSRQTIITRQHISGPHNSPTGALTVVSPVFISLDSCVTSPTDFPRSSSCKLLRKLKPHCDWKTVPIIFSWASSRKSNFK